MLICGGIGGGAQAALAAAGIKLFGGVSGDADKAVEAFINETLDYDPDVKCSHHEHSHVKDIHVESMDAEVTAAIRKDSKMMRKEWKQNMYAAQNHGS